MAVELGDQQVADPYWEIPNVRHLRALDAVRRHAGVSKASVEVNMSQPAVSLAIAKIETLVGQPLFIRRQNGSYPTPAGEVFLNRVRRFLDQCDQALLDVCAGKSAQIRHVTSAHVRCLLAIGRSGSFSEAARTLGISGASLHRAAREIEAILGETLYQGTKSGLVLSQCGAELARRLGLATRELEAAQDDLRCLHGVAGGRVAIGTLPMSGGYLIGAAVADLTNQFPEARVSIINAPYAVLLSALRSGSIDVIFGVLRRPCWATDIHEEALFCDPYCIVARSGHPLTTAKRVTIEDLVKFDWIIPGEGTPRRRAYESIFATSRLRPRAPIETSSLSTIRSVLANSDRLALVNRHEVEVEERLRLLSVVEWSSDLAPTPKGITTRYDWLPTPLQLRLLDQLRRHARAGERS